MSRFVADFGSIPQQANPEGRLDAPAFHRNHDPIWAAIGPWLTGETGDALEIGSGTGQHIVEFARKAPGLTWWPTDILDSHLRSIAAWRAQAALANLKLPQRLDLMQADWAPTGPGTLAAIVCINVLHIAPWPVSQHLVSGAGRLLRPGGRLFIYGPFKQNGAHIAPSNAEFDDSLRGKNQDWGVRDTTELWALAEQSDLSPFAVTPMPSNNFVLSAARA
jgi:SAM-dependent methyltransferase